MDKWHIAKQIIHKNSYVMLWVMFFLIFFMWKITAENESSLVHAVPYCITMAPFHSQRKCTLIWPLPTFSDMYWSNLLTTEGSFSCPSNDYCFYVIMFSNPVLSAANIHSIRCCMFSWPGHSSQRCSFLSWLNTPGTISLVHSLQQHTN